MLGNVGLARCPDMRLKWVEICASLGVRDCELVAVSSGCVSDLISL